MRQRIITNSEKETKELAKKLAKNLIRQKDKGAKVIALEGELGSGKTIFVKGFAESLGIKKNITSPTFILIKKYSFGHKNARPDRHKVLYHMDCYRIKDHRDISDLGWEEISENPQNIVIIEWADKIRKILPKGAIKIKFRVIDEKRREIKLDK